MTVWGVSMVKDEADVIEATVRHMLTQVDHVLIADNGSTDGTREILDSLDVEVVDDPEVGYFQSRKMSTLATKAADMGAEWVVPFDADEAWYSPFGRIADVLTERPESIATAQLYDHVPSAEDPAEGDHLERIGWRRRDPAELPKVAVRPNVPVTIHQGNHGADYGGTVDNVLVVRHFPTRSAEQMVRKARNGGAAYAATDLPKDVGAHWRQWNELTDEQLGEVFRQYYWSADPRSDSSLIYDPVPTAC